MNAATVQHDVAQALLQFMNPNGHGPNGYPIHFMVTVGDYREMTPIVIYKGKQLGTAVEAYERIAQGDYPQLFAVEADFDGEHRDSKRLTPDWWV